MAKPVRVYVEPRAQAVINGFDAAHRAQFLRLVAAIRIAPQAGVFYARDDRGRVLWQVSGSDLHMIYTVIYQFDAEHVFVVAIEVAPWNPVHTDMP